MTIKKAAFQWDGSRLSEENSPGRSYEAGYPQRRSPGPKGLPGAKIFAVAVPKKHREHIIFSQRALESAPILVKLKFILNQSLGLP